MDDTAAQVEARLPEAITRYQDARDQRDTQRALSAFAPDARVVDEAREYEGSDEIHGWLATAGHEFTFTRTLLGADTDGSDGWIVHNRLEGDFPGNVADLRYRFRLADGLIAELVIAP